MKKLVVLLMVGLVSLCGLASANSFSDSFDTLDPAWVNGDNGAAGFAVVVPFDGDNRLEIPVGKPNIDPAWSTSYRYLERNVGLWEPWIISGDFYLSLDMFSQTDFAWIFDFSAVVSDGSGVQGDVLTIGFLRDYQYPPIEDLSLGRDVRAWDMYVAGHLFHSDLLDIPLVAGWNTLSIENDGTSYSYQINDYEIYRDLIVNQFGSNLERVSLESVIHSDDLDEYSIYWDNVSATSLAAPVPEPASVLLLSLGVGAVALRRRFGKKW